MSIQHRPLSRRSNAIKDSEVPKYVGKLKRFLGYEALAKAQADLDKDLRHHGRCYAYWAQELRPWLFALRMYDHLTGNTVRTVSKIEWPPEIQKMAGDALMISSLHHAMTDEIKSKYRKDLLTGQHNDFMVEMHAAWHYYVEGFHLQWYPLHEKRPEFRVRGGGLDFDVECRRFGWDVSERVKTAAMADTCDKLYEVLLARDLWGEVKIEFLDDFRFDPGIARQWPQAVAQAFDREQGTVQLGQDVLLTLNLKPSPSQKYTREGLAELALDQQYPEAIWLVSKRDGELGVDPVVFRCRGPRKTPNELRDHIYNTLKNKVATQLSPDRAGVVVASFSGIGDPRVFNESEGMKEAIAKLFSRRYLAALVLKCHGIMETGTASFLHSTPANLFTNPETDFPQVAEAKHLSR